MGSKTEYLIGFIMTLVLSAIFVFILILGFFYHKPVIYDREVVGTVVGQVRYSTWEASYTVEGNQTFKTRISKNYPDKFNIGDTVRILYLKWFK